MTARIPLVLNGSIIEELQNGDAFAFTGSTSGVISLVPPAVAGTNTVTLPAATDTLVGKATTDTLTNKSISGSTNTLSNIANTSLTNSTVTIGSTSVALGATVTTFAGVTLTSPTFTTPALGTPASGIMTNVTGLPISTGVSGLGTNVATALAVNVGTAGAFVVNGGALGTPISGTVTNLSGTASININGTVGATTANTGAFTTLSGSSITNTSFGTAGVVTNNASGLLATVSTLSGTYGGTGVNNGSNTITIAGNLSHTGAFTQTIAATANTSVTLPTSGTIISSVTALPGAVTGTPSSSNYLRGDGTWSAVAASGVSSFTAGTTGLTPNTATTGAVTLAGTLATTNGGTGLTSFTANGVVYASSTSALATGSALTFDGTTLTASNSAATAGNFKATSTTAQVLNVTASNDANTTVGLLVFGSAASALGMLGAGAPALYTAATELNLMANNGSGVIKFAAGGTSEQMRLTSTGLGIGTSSPAAKLHISSSTDTRFRTDSGATNSPYAVFVNTTVTTVGTENSSGGNLVAGSSAYATVLSNNGAYPLQLGTNNTVRASLDSSGNLGLGVTPSAWGAGNKAIDLPNYGTLAFGGTGGSITGNAYYNAGWKYKTNDYATKYDTQQSAGIHAWFTAPSGTAGNAITFTQAMTLSAAGGLSVGTTADPGAGNLAVGSTTIGGSNLSVYKASGDTRIYVGNSSSTTAQIGCESGGNTVYIGSTTSTPVIFRINDTEAARIDTSGNLLVGGTFGSGVQVFYNNTDGINSRSGQAAGSTRSLYTGWYSATSTTQGTLSFNVTTNGNVTNTNNSYGAISDAKLKHNITLSGSQWNDVKALGSLVKKYSLITDETNTQQIGWIAQDAQTVSPGLVYSTPDKDIEGNLTGESTLGINYSVAYMKAFKALSEALVRIEQLETQVTALKG